jgi:GNAT superfamily N-acetyltransferase
MSGVDITEIHPLNLREFMEFVKSQGRLHPSVKEAGHFFYSSGTLDHLYLKGVYLNNQLIGVATVVKEDSTLLERIYIDPDFRRKGYGEFAVNSLQIERAELPARSIELVRFYESLGFVNMSKCQDIAVMIRQKVSNYDHG